MPSLDAGWTRHRCRRPGPACRPRPSLEGKPVGPRRAEGVRAASREDRRDPHLKRRGPPRPATPPKRGNDTVACPARHIDNRSDRIGLPTDGGRRRAPYRPPRAVRAPPGPAATATTCLSARRRGPRSRPAPPASPPGTETQASNVNGRSSVNQSTHSRRGSDNIDRHLGPRPANSGDREHPLINAEVRHNGTRCPSRAVRLQEHPRPAPSTENKTGGGRARQINRRATHHLRPSAQRQHSGQCLPMSPAGPEGNPGPRVHVRKSPPVH